MRNSPTEWVKLHSPGNARGMIPVFRTAPTVGEIHHPIGRKFLNMYSPRTLIVLCCSFSGSPPSGGAGCDVRCTPGVTGAMQFYPRSGVLQFFHVNRTF
jgi:hypothetical protein